MRPGKGLYIVLLDFVIIGYLNKHYIVSILATPITQKIRTYVVSRYSCYFSHPANIQQRA